MVGDGREEGAGYPASLCSVLMVGGGPRTVRCHASMAREPALTRPAVLRTPSVLSVFVGGFPMANPKAISLSVRCPKTSRCLPSECDMTTAVPGSMEEGRQPSLVGDPQCPFIGGEETGVSMPRNPQSKRSEDEEARERARMLSIDSFEGRRCDRVEKTYMYSGLQERFAIIVRLWGRLSVLTRPV